MLYNDKWDLLLHRGLQSYLKIKSTDSSPALNSNTFSCDANENDRQGFYVFLAERLIIK